MAATQPKPRVIVLTDIGGDPDDKQSLVRLLLYANDMDIEGLYATAHKRGNSPEEIRKRVKAYGQVLDHLRIHDPSYPDAAVLEKIIHAGATERTMKSVGSGKSTAASRALIEVVDRNDPRPVWVSVWGAPTDLAQALWDVKESRTAVETRQFADKLRVYGIAGQDATGAWIAHEFPQILYLRSVLQFQAISERISIPFPREVAGPHSEFFDESWIAENVQSHGPLGALYPPRKHKYEGDSPAFLHLIPNGLSDPERVHQGNWGGRFNAWKTVNPSAFRRFYSKAQAPFEPFSMHTEAADTWSYQGEDFVHSTTAALFRWREPTQNDFAARMDWSITSEFEAANHPPIAVIGGDQSNQVIYKSVLRGETMELNASRSSDPDGDTLSFRWWFYPEPGSSTRSLPIKDSHQPLARVKIPEVFSDETYHIILEVTDNGKPALTRYRRVVVKAGYE
ncbi:MAG: DUF1593 domain-containing protein [Synoicihabitans sp.]